MSRLFQDQSKGLITNPTFTGTPTLAQSAAMSGLSTSSTALQSTSQTVAAIKSKYKTYTPAITYQTAATIGAHENSLVFDAAGNLYWAISNRFNGTTYNLTSYVYKITPAGTLTTFASAATIGAIGNSLVFDAAGNLYWAISNRFNGTTYNLTSYVYKITPAGTLTTFASAATNGAYGNSLVFDAAGNLYWGQSNHYNNTTYNLTSYVYKITSAGAMTTFASAATNGAYGNSLVFDAAGNLYWAISNYFNETTYNLTSYVYKITSAGAMTTFASAATIGATLNSLVFDAAGNLYWGQSNNYNGTTYNLTSYVYKITSAGAMTTFASAATNGAVGNSLVFDAAGNLYWAISNNYNGTTYNLTSYVYSFYLQTLS